MPNNFPQENSVNSPLLVNIDGKSIEILAPYNPNHSDIDQYVPSTDFRKKVHKDVESLAGNLNGFFSLYNHWIKGHTKCDYTVVMEMTMRSNLISSQFNTISKACKNDRSLPESQPLTITEQVELIGLSEELGVSPSEVINLMKKHLQKLCDMTVSRLTAAESYELANLVRNIGVKNVLLILRKAASPKKAKRLYKVQQLPTDIRARIAVMLSSRRYTQKDILSYVNNEIEHRGLADKFKISRTAFNRFLNEEIYPSLSNQ